MAAPADSSTTTTTTASHDDEALVKTTTKPLPRAIQLVMTISSLLEPSTAASTKTIGDEHDWADRFLAWMKLFFLPSMCIATAALSAYDVLRDDDDDEVISGAGGFVYLAVLVLPHIYLAVVLAAGGHLGLFAPQTPYAAWEPIYKVGFKGMGLPVIFTSFGAMMPYTLMPDQAWLLIVACAYLLGLLVASTIAFWLCLRRTYGGERREKSSSGTGSEAVIDGLAYLYSRLLYDYAARFLADADAVSDASIEQLDTDSSSLE